MTVRPRGSSSERPISWQPISTAEGKQLYRSKKAMSSSFLPAMASALAAPFRIAGERIQRERHAEISLNLQRPVRAAHHNSFEPPGIERQRQNRRGRTLGFDQFNHLTAFAVRKVLWTSRPSGQPR